MSVKVTVNRFTRLTNTEDCDTSCSSCSWNQTPATERATDDLSPQQELARALARKEHLTRALERVEAAIAAAATSKADPQA